MRFLKIALVVFKDQFKQNDVKFGELLNKKTYIVRVKNSANYNNSIQEGKHTLS
jgi:hypothetical protein